MAKYERVRKAYTGMKVEPAKGYTMDQLKNMTTELFVALPRKEQEKLWNWYLTGDNWFMLGNHDMNKDNLTKAMLSNPSTAGKVRKKYVPVTLKLDGIAQEMIKLPENIVYETGELPEFTVTATNPNKTKTKLWTPEQSIEDLREMATRDPKMIHYNSLAAFPYEERARHAGDIPALMLGIPAAGLMAGPAIELGAAAWPAAKKALDAYFTYEIANDIANGNFGDGSMAAVLPAVLSSRLRPLGKITESLGIAGKGSKRLPWNWFNRAAKTTAEATTAGKATAEAGKVTKEAVKPLGELAGGTAADQQVMQELAKDAGITIKGAGEAAKGTSTFFGPIKKGWGATKTVGKWTATRAAPFIIGLSIPYDVFGHGLLGLPEFWSEFAWPGLKKFVRWRNRRYNNDNADNNNAYDFSGFEPIDYQNTNTEKYKKYFE